MHQFPIMVDYCAKYEQNKLILFWDISTNVGIITQIWHRAKWYFACIGNKWYLITWPNMNKIHTFFSEIPQQIHKMNEKVAIITQIGHRAKCNFTSMNNVWYLMTTTYEKKSPHSFPRYLNKHSKVRKNYRHNYSKLAHSQILFYMR